MSARRPIFALALVIMAVLAPAAASGATRTMDLGSGSVERVSGTDLGSGRVERVSGTDLGSGRFEKVSVGAR